MFTRTVVSASVLASALAGPIMMRRPIARDSISLGGSSIGGSSLGGFSSGLSSGGFDSDLFGSDTVTPIWSFDNSVFDDSSISLTQFSSSLSFDHFGGLSSLNGFDSFFGADNFCGISNTQTFVQSETITCESQSIDFVQQQLAIITEYAKHVILASTCEVEAQTIVLEQWISTLQVFSSDIRHETVSREVTYDSQVASFISDICDSEGNPIFKDFGFDGTDIGSSCVTIEGLNWNDETSPASCSSAFSACQTAAGFSISPPTISSISSSCGDSCSFIPPSLSSSCDSSDCGSSSISEIPPPSSSCYGSDCSSSISELPPSCDGSDCGSSDSDCYGSDCGSSVSELPPSCDGSDCGSSVSELPPSCDGSDCGSSDDSDCDGSDCSSDDSTLAPPVETDSSGDVATLSDGSVSTDDGDLSSDDGDLSTDSIDLPDSTDSAGDDSVDATGASDDTAAPAATIASLTPVGAAAPTAVGST